MRIVYTVLNGHMAGGQKVCLEILEEARRRGHQVCLVSPSCGEMTQRLEAMEVPVYLIPMEHTFQFHRAWQFARFLREWRADLVHCHAFVAGSILARLACKIAGVPILCHAHAHNYFNSNPVIRAWQIWLDTTTAQMTDGIIAVSESIRQTLIQQGIPSCKVAVVHNGIRVTQIDGLLVRRRLTQELGIDCRDRIVGTVGRLSQQKGQLEFLQAAQKVSEKFPRAYFLIVGEDLEFGGQYQRELEDWARRLGLGDRVIFTGHRADAAQLMYALHVFVLPSWMEGLPVSVLEAMAAARPVIATLVGGVPEVVQDGKTGILVSPKNAEELADAIIYLLENPNIAVNMGLRGQARVREHFALSRKLDEIMALYNKVVRCSGSPDNATRERENVQFYNTPDDKRYGRETLPEFQEEIRSLICRECPQETPLILELGSGAGAFKDFGAGYFAMDLSYYALARFLPGVRRVQANAETIPLSAGCVDFLFSIATLEHVPHPERFLTEIDRVLKARGLAFLAPAWFCRPWAARGVAVKPFAELSWDDRILKLSLPLLEFKPVRIAQILPRRLLLELVHCLKRQPLPFRYKRLQPNLSGMVQSDSDAWVSMDPHAAILFFLSRGYEIVSAPDWRSRLTVPNAPVIVRKG